jgi:hypothetical protein
MNDLATVHDDGMAVAKGARATKDEWDFRVEALGVFQDHLWSGASCRQE